MLGLSSAYEEFRSREMKVACFKTGHWNKWVKWNATIPAQGYLYHAKCSFTRFCLMNISSPSGALAQHQGN